MSEPVGERDEPGEPGPEGRSRDPALHPAGGDTPPPLLGDADMPPLDSLGPESDYSGFLSPGVSEELRRLALRKLFHSPLFNVTDGLDDYDDDFTSFAVLREAFHAKRAAARSSEPTGSGGPPAETTQPGGPDRAEAAEVSPVEAGETAQPAQTEPDAHLSADSIGTAEPSPEPVEPAGPDRAEAAEVSPVEASGVVQPAHAQPAARLPVESAGEGEDGALAAQDRPARVSDAGAARSGAGRATQEADGPDEPGRGSGEESRHG